MDALFVGKACLGTRSMAAVTFLAEHKTRHEPLQEAYTHEVWRRVDLGVEQLIGTWRVRKKCWAEDKLEPAK